MDNDGGRDAEAEPNANMRARNRDRGGRAGDRKQTKECDFHGIELVAAGRRYCACRCYAIRGVTGLGGKSFDTLSARGLVDKALKRRCFGPGI